MTLVLVNTVNGTELWCVPTTLVSVLRPWISYAGLELTDDELRDILRFKPDKDKDRDREDPVYLDLRASRLFVRLQSLKSEQLDRVDMHIVHDACVAN